jgi:serine/threonine protein kinase
MSVDSRSGDSFVGSVLQGTYQIVRLIGEGGMGAVYEARQVRLNKRVAVKVMARELTTNTESLTRFHREAEITSGLGHPHIVQVFDFSTTPTGEPFLAMEFLEGEDLDQRIRRIGRLAPANTIRIIRQVASALAAAHAKQIVHRDLKPANIYLLTVAGEDDFVKVLDFGISKVRTATMKLTKAAALIGTPDYMSPEQALAQDDKVDDRTDQWALACIAWECLSGKGPFVSESIPSLLFQVVHQPPPALASRVSDLPQGVEEVLLRALAKNRDERFASVVEFAQALEGAISGTPVALDSVQPAPHAKVDGQPATLILADSGRAASGSQPATTTFSRAASEIGDETEARRSRPTWIWVVVGVAATLVLAGFLVLRSDPASKSRAAHSTLPVAEPQAGPLPVPTSAIVPEPPPRPPAAAAIEPSPKPAEGIATGGSSPQPGPAAVRGSGGTATSPAAVEAKVATEGPAPEEPRANKTTRSRLKNAKAPADRKVGRRPVPSPSSGPDVGRRLIEDL